VNTVMKLGVLQNVRKFLCSCTAGQLEASRETLSTMESVECVLINEDYFKNRTDFTAQGITNRSASTASF
jgi:hypothetical protein